MNRKTINQIVFYIMLIAVWKIVVLLKIWPTYIFPSPEMVAKTILKGFQNSTFWVAISISMRRLAIGYFLSLLGGICLGVLMYKVKLIDDAFGGLILGLQSLPSICWLPLALIWFGLNESAIIFIVIMGSLFSITVTTRLSIQNIPPLFIKAGRNMGANRWKLLLFVIVPATMPSMINGLKQAWSFAWRSLMAGELVFGNLGLGYLLLMGRELNDLSQVFGIMIIIAGISVIIDKVIFGSVEMSISRRWGFKKQ